MNLAQLIDEYFKRRKSVEDLSVEEYIKEHPEFSEELQGHFDEELFWLKQFKETVELSEVVSTKEELNKGWRRLRIKLLWTEIKEGILRLVESIKIKVSNTGIDVIIPEIIQPFVTQQVHQVAMLGEEEITHEIEIPMMEIKGNLKLSIEASNDRDKMVIKVQPRIRMGIWGQRPIQLILKDIQNDKTLMSLAVKNNDFQRFTVSPDGQYSISLKCMGKTFEVPLDLSNN